MFGEEEESVYKLVTDLCRHFVESNKEDHLFGATQNNELLIRKLRAKSYDILLNKTSATVNNKKKDVDPVCELLKHAYILRSTGKTLEADELEKCLETLSQDGLNSNSSTFSVLTFFDEIKSLESKTCHDLNVFDIKKYSQDLPAFEKYSVESLKTLSKRFERVLLSQSVNNKNTSQRLPFIVRPTLTDNNINAIEYERPEEIYQFITPASSKIFRLPSSSQISIKTYQSSNVWDEEFKKHKYLTSKEGIVTEPESPWQNTDTETVSENWENQTQINFCEQDQLEEDLWNKIVNVEPREVSQFRTWESLGILEPAKEPNFIAETKDSMIHLTQTKHMYSKNFSGKTNEPIQPLKVISTEKLMENLKLLLVGIESDCFCYHNMSFRLVSNIILPEISREALESFCTELIRMGNCYRSLTDLVSQDNKSDIFESEGLIFKALCQSVNEVLSFYQTSIFLLKPRDKGLISFMNTVRPLTLLISDIAVLCDFKNQNTTFEGINILTHIYQQANTITRPNTSLVITSILKSCCEVYFRMLSQWLFEGACEDVYDEFMIKTKLKYVNVQGHRFWTRAFAINHKSVPGFLRDLADSILECGKTMRLLKICDPKNPVCHLSAKFHPTVKVCFTEKMQLEQMQFFVDYFEKGKEAIGESVSICSAIQQEKDALKSKREIIDLVHKERFLKRQEARKADLKKIAEKKNNLLVELKTQAEESAKQKLKTRNAEILADKIYLENVMQQEEEKRNAEKLKKAETQKYYEDLALESEKCQLRAEWRIKRMANFDERILLLSSLEKEAQSQFSNFENPVGSVDQIEFDLEIPESQMEVELEIPESQNPQTEAENPESEIVDKESETDPNKNVEKGKPTDDNENQEDKLSVEFEEAETSIPKRPNVLNLSTEMLSKSLVPTDNMSEAKRNRLRMLREEFGISPNNNSETDSVFSSDSKTRDEEMNFIGKDFRLKQLEEINSNRLKIMTHRMDENWADFQQEKKVYGSDLVRQNRTRNMAHQGWDEEKISVLKESSREENFSAAQKNKNRVMKYSAAAWFDSKEVMDNDAVYNEIETSPQILETPMSCTTDYFTHSTNSVAYQSCEESPQFDFESESTENSIETAQPRKSALKLCQHSYGFFQSSPNVQCDSTDSATLTVEDVRMLNSFFLQEHLKKSVLVPLQVQSNLVNSAIIKCFILDHNLLSHLHSLRSYFFLLNGEFAKSLTNSLYTKLYQASMPVEMLNSTFLKNTLEKAISCSISHNYMNSELLSLSVMNMPEKLDASNPEVLDCISLNYKISWPINIIFDEAIMGQYSKVFQFLLMVGRILWVLQEEFPILKFETKKNYNEQFHKIHLYRFSMMQFMNAVHTYLTCSVLNASWSEFESQLETAETLDTFYAAHVSYMKKILSRCMLTQRSEMILNALRQTFGIILKFHSRITSHSWISGKSGRIHPNFGLLEEMYNSFCQQRAYVVHVAEKFSTSGYQPHLTHFLHALNINNSFKLNAKKNSQF